MWAASQVSDLISLQAGKYETALKKYIQIRIQTPKQDAE